jgi:hypothetical protein
VAALTRIRVLREQELVKADPGDVREVDAATARALVEQGAAERVIDRSNSDIERS